MPRILGCRFAWLVRQAFSQVLDHMTVQLALRVNIVMKGPQFAWNVRLDSSRQRRRLRCVLYAAQVIIQERQRPVVLLAFQGNIFSLKAQTTAETAR
jgi:hypothetical protein